MYQQYFFIRLLVPLAVGICIHYVGVWNIPWAIAWVCLAIVLCLWVLLSRTMHYTHRWLHGISVDISLCLLGFLITAYQYPAKTFDLGTQAIVGKVTEVSIRNNSCTFVLNPHNHAYKAVKVHIYDTAKQFPQPHADVVVYGNIESIEHVDHPSGYNEATYANQKGIYQRMHVKGSSWATLENHSPNWIEQLNRYTLQRIDQFGLDTVSNGVAKALLLGYKAELDKDAQHAFSVTGTMHILAVSGLHVGIVFLLFQKLLFFANRWRWGAIVRCVLLLFFLWVYTAMCGAAPSILRASIMLSLFCIADAFSLPSKGLNTLGCSAFILLCLHPANLFDIGFQLSYLAVGSLLTMYPYWKQKNPWSQSKVFTYVWDMSGISICAQLITTPISLHYFGQFPNYFLITNLVLVPLSSLVLYLGVGALLAGWIPGVYELCVMGFTYSLQAMLHINYWFSELPGAVTYIKPLSMLTTCMLYVGLAGCMYFFIRVSMLRLQLILGVFIVLAVLSLCSQSPNQTQFYVWIKKKEPVLYISEPSQAYTWVVSREPKNTTEIIRQAAIYQKHIPHSGYSIPVKPYLKFTHPQCVIHYCDGFLPKTHSSVNHTTPQMLFIQKAPSLKAIQTFLKNTPIRGIIWATSQNEKFKKMQLYCIQTGVSLYAFNSKQVLHWMLLHS